MEHDECRALRLDYGLGKLWFFFCSFIFLFLETHLTYGDGFTRLLGLDMGNDRMQYGRRAFETNGWVDDVLAFCPGG